jgi:hypothetical protein
MGNFIDSINIPEIPPFGDTVLIIPWNNVPNINDYCAFAPESTFYLLARIESAHDTMTYREGTNIIINTKNNRMIAMRSINFLRQTSLLIRDTLSDLGIEPTPCTIISESPDIWVEGYYEPNNILSNWRHPVYIHVKNVGCPTQEKSVLKLYWAKSDLGMDWPTHWNDNSSNTMPLGQFIDSVVLPPLPSNADTTVRIFWTTPEPDYYSAPPCKDITLFTLLARIEEKGLPSFETNDVEMNARNNKNIALKDVRLNHKVDFLIRDNETDIGIEPNPYTGDYWDSPDVTISKNWDAIHVRVKNIGNRHYVWNENATISLYWSDEITAGANWEPLLQSAPLWLTLVPNLPLQDEDEYVFHWYDHPNPADYANFPDGSLLFYILAEVRDSVKDYPLSFMTGDIEADVKNSNNLAGKAVKVENRYDLMVKDSPYDVGDEPNYNASYMYVSPDIWVRQQDDKGIVHENPQSGARNYVYVRVHNIGRQPSLGADKLELHWAKAGTNLAWPTAWDGSLQLSGVLMGDLVSSLTIPPIQSGQDFVLTFPWDVPPSSDYAGLTADPFHFCLLARIVSQTDPIRFPEMANIGTNVENNNNIAQRNITVLEFNSSGPCPPRGAIAVGNLSTEAHSYCLQFNLDENSTSLIKESEISIRLDNTLYDIWKKGGGEMKGLKLIADKTFLVQEADARLNNLIFNPEQIGILSVGFNFLTREITEQANYEFHVMQTDCETGNIMGGELYSIIKSPRKPFYANAGEVIYASDGEDITLAAEEIKEPTTYNWYLGDKLVSTGVEFTTTAVVGNRYKLEVISLLDGFKDYAEVEVQQLPTDITDIEAMEKSLSQNSNNLTRFNQDNTAEDSLLNVNKILSLHPNPATDEITVTYQVNGVNEAAVFVTSHYHRAVYDNYVLDVNAQSRRILISSYPIGVYIVTLVCDGVVEDAKIFVKY